MGSLPQQSDDYRGRNAHAPAMYRSVPWVTLLKRRSMLLEEVQVDLEALAVRLHELDASLAVARAVADALKLTEEEKVRFASAFFFGE